ESHEQASQARSGGALEKIWHEHSIDGPRRLPEAAHPLHPVEQARRKSAIAEEMIVEEVQMTTGQPLDLGQGGIDRLRVKPFAAFEKRLLVAEVTDMRTAARDDNRIRHQIKTTPDEIASNRRHTL